MPTPAQVIARVVAREIAIQFRRKIKELEKETRKAEKQSADDLLEVARQLSSGPMSLRTMRRLGHPYAKRRPHPPYDPGIINKQTGAFRKGWRVRGPRKSGDALKTRLENVAPKAVFILKQGPKSLMMPRPIFALIRKKMKPIREKNLRKAIRDALLRR